MTGPGATFVQIVGETRLAVDCKVNPATLVGHVTITSDPIRMIVSRGGGGGDGSVRLNTVPLPGEMPPPIVVPYKVLSDKITPPHGESPSLRLKPAKLCRFVKPLPLVLTANTVPPPGPPPLAVPYRVLPDKNNLPIGKAPSLLV